MLVQNKSTNSQKVYKVKSKQSLSFSECLESASDEEEPKILSAASVAETIATECSPLTEHETSPIHVMEVATFTTYLDFEVLD